MSGSGDGSHHHNLRPRLTDPISHCAIPRQRLYWLNGQQYDVCVLARTLHSIGRSVDPIHQTPLRKAELAKIDTHLRRIGSTLPSVRSLTQAPRPTPGQACAEDNLRALEIQANEYMAAVYSAFEVPSATDPFVAYESLPLVNSVLQQMARLDRTHAIELLDIYIQKLRGPPNNPTADRSGFLLRTCLSVLRRYDRALRGTGAGAARAQ